MLIVLGYKQLSLRILYFYYCNQFVLKETLLMFYSLYYKFCLYIVWI